MSDSIYFTPVLKHIPTEILTEEKLEEIYGKGNFTLKHKRDVIELALSPYGAVAIEIVCSDHDWKSQEINHIKVDCALLLWGSSDLNLTREFQFYQLLSNLRSILSPLAPGKSARWIPDPCGGHDGYYLNPAECYLDFQQSTGYFLPQWVRNLMETKPGHLQPVQDGWIDTSPPPASDDSIYPDGMDELEVLRDEANSSEGVAFEFLRRFKVDPMVVDSATFQAHQLVSP